MVRFSLKLAARPSLAPSTHAPVTTNLTALRLLRQAPAPRKRDSDPDPPAQQSRRRAGTSTDSVVLRAGQGVQPPGLAALHIDQGAASSSFQFAWQAIDPATRLALSHSDLEESRILHSDRCAQRRSEGLPARTPTSDRTRNTG